MVGEDRMTSMNNILPLIVLLVCKALRSASLFSAFDLLVSLFLEHLQLSLPSPLPSSPTTPCFLSHKQHVVSTREVFPSWFFLGVYSRDVVWFYGSFLGLGKVCVGWKV